MSKLHRKRLRAIKRVIHEDYIDKLWNNGIPRSLIYKKISLKLGYDFHCSTLTEYTDFTLIIEAVKSSCVELDEDFRNR